MFPAFRIDFRRLLLLLMLVSFGAGAVLADPLENCEDPVLTGYVLDDGCEFCGPIWSSEQRYWETEVSRYKCANGGTATVTVEYTAPCPIC